jgi:ATP-dependent phosphofructokinase / diphosphate-dependent phosphofructokinase
VNAEEYEKIFNIFEDMSIDTFFYIGGNDSMDTVHMLSKYAETHKKNVKIMGIPKTIDNDLAVTDHTPGFGSAAKFISTITLECCCDTSVYNNNGVIIIETMGRDTGWLAAGASVAAIDGRSAADLIYLPEKHFNIESFLEDVNSIYTKQKRVVVVASEGLKDESNKMLTELYTCAPKDNFGHVQLGGVSAFLKNLIIDKGITKKARNIELSILQRCAMHCASDTDIEEAAMVGRSAFDYAVEGYSGKMVAIKRLSNAPYASDTFLANASDVANHIKYFPMEWINEYGNKIKQEGIDYIRPLVDGEPEFEHLGGLPHFATVPK